MEVFSPIGNFQKVLQQVRTLSHLYHEKLSRNEAATRAALIDPVLKALGWDMANPNMVEFEKTFNDTRVDYALYDCQNKIQVIVEAKALGTNLNDSRIFSRLVLYVFTHGVKDIFLTDGIQWLHFSQWQPGNTDSVSLDLANDQLVYCSEYLINKLDAAHYWNEEFVDQTPKKTSPVPPIPSPKLTAPDSRPVDIPHRLPVAKSPESRHTFLPRGTPAENKTIDIQGFVPLNSLYGDLRGNRPPKWLRLPDGSMHAIGTWRKILRECVLFVLAHNPNLPIPLLDKAQRSVYLINNKRTAEEVTIEEVIYNQRTVYIYENYDANNTIANALYILKFAPEEYKKTPVMVSFEEKR